VTGWVSRPQLHRRTADGIFTLVNRRHVRDRVVQHALFQGYAQRLVKGQYPLAVLFLAVPFGEVDVNVHPAKNEVRFARPGGIHEVIRRAVAQTLYDIDRPQWKPAAPHASRVAEAASGDRDWKAAPTAEQSRWKDAPTQGHRGGAPLPQGTAPSRENGIDVRGASSHDRRSGTEVEDRGRHAAPAEEHRDPEFAPAADGGPLPFVGEAPGLDGRDEAPPSQAAESATRDPASRTLDSSSRIPDRGWKAAPTSSHRAQVELWETRGFAGLRVVGQFHNTYIVCEAEDGLILIDQHAAHERVLYDRLCRAAQSASAPAGQALLVPETIELRAREMGALDRLRPHLRTLGLEVEPFGGGTVVVKSVPAFLSGREVRPLVVEIAAAASAPDGPVQAAAVLDFCRQRAACHGAIRARQALAREQMEGLLQQLDACANLSHCPHGRPTWLKWETAVIERSFRRIA